MISSNDYDLVLPTDDIQQATIVENTVIPYVEFLLAGKQVLTIYTSHCYLWLFQVIVYLQEVFTNFREFTGPVKSLKLLLSSSVKFVTRRECWFEHNFDFPCSFM